ncbi:pyridoxal phosphate-dependent aminotransferase [Acidihalobacter prosperus]|uniref:Aminotransferase n=1 Tax=Acidihalobacter prosperus TaxID=160660 RepID=A0A1A6C7X6_9GAMM|nr:pyridoxal phosphate-dependent aminotransferase [Acidihalobacter prosperus]OBS10649.1 aminotransferase [Acidihalobacter prosperus]
MHLRTARRIDDIASFRVMDLLARARQLEAEGRRIVHLEIGEPDFDTPTAIVEAGRAALQAGATRYTPALGLPALREAIAGFYATHYGVTISPERVIVTPGASGALQLVLGVLVDPDTEVLMTDPGYPCNRHFVRLFEGRARQVMVRRDTRYQLTPELLRAHWSKRTVAALVASPANPTGTLIAKGMLAEMAAYAAEREGALIVDEIYQGLVYDQPDATALEISDQVFVVNSFSKYFGMTGWRLGWIVAPEAYVRPIEKLAQNLFLCAPTPSQHAALAAFEPEVLSILEGRRAEFRTRRDFLLPELRALGFNIPVTPDGAFYLYANCERFGVDAETLSARLLEEAGVAVTPGTDFGENGADQHIRFAYTTGMDDLKEAVARLRDFFKRA